MKRVWLMCAIAILFLAAAAQEDAPPGFEHWTPSAFKNFDDKLRATAATDPHHFAVELLTDFTNDSAMLVHREADGQAELHETQADILFVQSGSATLVVGGTLENGETVSPHEKRNGTIRGGARQKLAAGDIVRIPARTPHQLLLQGSPEFNYFVVKIKGY
jgi:mannose-6-phosphate isomerase-like protein (cupin superfamily)